MFSLGISYAHGCHGCRNIHDMIEECFGNKKKINKVKRKERSIRNQCSHPWRETYESGNVTQQAMREVILNNYDCFQSYDKQIEVVNKFSRMNKGI